MKFHQIAVGLFACIALVVLLCYGVVDLNQRIDNYKERVHEWKVFSIDMFGQKSQESQLAEIEAEGWEVVNIFSDYCGSQYRVIARKKWK